MNKTELVQKVAARIGTPELNVNQVISSALDLVQTALVRGERVTLMGFGVFEVVDRAARTGRNPRTGKPIKIPATKTTRFRPGKGLKETIEAV